MHEVWLDRSADGASREAGDVEAVPRQGEAFFYVGALELGEAAWHGPVALVLE